ncbi:MAG: hypothetical protein WD066_18825 [Planctomycetaceae bacterium]
MLDDSDLGTGVAEPEAPLEADGDDHEHEFVAYESASADFTVGNAKCTVTTRWLVLCTACGQTHFRDDPDQPEFLRARTRD